MEAAAAREAHLKAAAEVQQKLDELWLTIARASAPLNSTLDEFIDTLTQGIFSESAADVEELKVALSDLQATQFPAFKTQHAEYTVLCGECDALAPKGVEKASNPYAVHSQEEIEGKWAQVEALVPTRAVDLDAEAAKQEARNALKLKWAEEGTAGMAAIANLHAEILKVSINQDSTPEENKDGLKALSDQCDAFQPSMTSLETLSAQLEAELIFENEHCPLTIEQVRGNLNSLSVKIQSVDASLTNQILTRDATNITEEQMEEFKASFNHFDKDKSGYLDQLEFRGCLLSLGMDIPQIAAEGTAYRHTVFAAFFLRSFFFLPSAFCLFFFFILHGYPTGIFPPFFPFHFVIFTGGTSNFMLTSANRDTLLYTLYCVHCRRRCQVRRDLVSGEHAG